MNTAKKRASESRITITKRFLPKDANTAGNLHGGALMRHMDFVAAIVALRHARSRIITAGIEHMDFVDTMKPGEILHCHASVNCVHGASMEIGIRGEVEDPYTGAMRHVLTCYLHFMGVNEEGHSIPLPALEAETDEDGRRMGEGARRLALSRLEFKKSPLRAVRCVLTALPGRYALCFAVPWSTAAEILPDAFPDGELMDGIPAMTSNAQGLCLLLAQERALLLAAKHPQASLQTDLCCLRLHEPSGQRAAPAASELITLLAGNGISTHIVALGGSAVILLDKRDEDAVSVILADSGHILAQV